MFLNFSVDNRKYRNMNIQQINPNVPTKATYSDILRNIQKGRHAKAYIKDVDKHDWKLIIASHRNNRINIE